MRFDESSETNWPRKCFGIAVTREPGFTRKRMGRYWAYFDGEKRVTDRATIDRLNSIALPPAYKDAWFCKDPDGHLQATGIDDRGRKQYRYHPDFRAKAEASKFAGLRRIRQRAAQDPAQGRQGPEEARARARTRSSPRWSGCSTTNICASATEAYAKENKSFGATTLLSRQVHDDGRKVKMRFRGKSGVEHEVTITDRTLRRVVRQLQELPGQPLFQYVNGDGNPHPITSSDVNDYIREATGGDFTAKHFRTWGASVLAFEQIARRRPRMRGSASRR